MSGDMPKCHPSGAMSPSVFGLGWHCSLRVTFWRDALQGGHHLYNYIWHLFIGSTLHKWAKLIGKILNALDMFMSSFRQLEICQTLSIIFKQSKSQHATSKNIISQTSTSLILEKLFHKVTQLYFLKRTLGFQNCWAKVQTLRLILSKSVFHIRFFCSLI